MKIWDIFSQELYEEMLAGNFIRVQKHPTLPLNIAVYTEITQFDKIWNEVTRACRGLIFDDEFNLVSRPFPKFGNYGENQSDTFLLDYPVEVTDKMDGSLGIYWQYGNQHGIATKGSFASDQAIRATKMWDEKYGFPISPCWTYLFEIIYPGNRIVLNYGDMDELVLLGVMDNEEGVVIPAERVYTWRGPRTPTFPYKTLREALEAPPRTNAEGFVIYFPDLQYRVKLKQDDYVKLHKIVTGLTKRRVWENMKAGQTLEDICEIVPDEWHEWLQETYWEIDADLRAISRVVYDDYFKYLRETYLAHPDDWSRKYFAEAIKDHKYKGFIFLLLDGAEMKMRSKMFDAVYPAAD